MSAKSRETQRYADIAFEATQKAGRTLIGVVSAPYIISDITVSAVETWEAQWVPINNRKPPDGGWDWKTIRREHNRNKSSRFRFAIWSDEVLCGLATGYLNNTAVVIEAVECHPSDTHPLKGDVMLIVLEASAMYAQGTGRGELWLKDPVEELITFYRGFGFTLEKRGGNAQFMIRGI